MPGDDGDDWAFIRSSQLATSGSAVLVGGGVVPGGLDWVEPEGGGGLEGVDDRNVVPGGMDEGC